MQAPVRGNLGVMGHFLIVYDRGSGRLIRQEAHPSAEDAMRARFVAEAEYEGQPDIEIVAVDAASEDELRRTHGRYFMDRLQLGARLT